MILIKIKSQNAINHVIFIIFKDIKIRILIIIIKSNEPLSYKIRFFQVLQQYSQFVLQKYNNKN